MEAGSSPASVPNGASEASRTPTAATVKEDSETKPAAAAAAAAAPYMYSTKVLITVLDTITGLIMHPSGCEGTLAELFQLLQLSSSSLATFLNPCQKVNLFERRMQEEAKDAFKELLASVQVSSEWSWEQTMRLIISDPRCTALCLCHAKRQWYQ